MVTVMEKLVLDGGAPLDIALKFRDTVRPNLVQQQHAWYDYAGTHYTEVEHQTIRQSVQSLLGNATRGKLLDDGTMQPLLNDEGKPIPFQPHPGDIRAAIDMLGGEVHLPKDTLSPPSWLRDPPEGWSDDSAKFIIPFQNCLLDVRTRTFVSHTPDFFGTYCLPMDYDPDAKPPQIWLDFLDQIMCGRQHLIDSLVEAIGYTISQDRTLQALFFGRGGSGSGKGTVGRVLTALCGRNNCAFPSMSVLGEKYGLENTLDKIAIIIADLTMGKNTDTAIAAERLKNISGQDPVDVRRMAKPSFTAITLPGILWLFSNIMPNFGSATEALMRRLVCWPFDGDFRDNPDPTLSDRLCTPENLSGIMTHVLDALDRLRARGRFEQTPESMAIKQKLLGAQSTVAAFIVNRCKLDKDARIETDVLWRAYVDYCEEVHTPPDERNWVMRNLAKAVSDTGGEIEHTRAVYRDDERKQVPGWCGIRLNDDLLPRYYQANPKLIDLDDGDLDLLGYPDRLLHPLRPHRYSDADDFGPG
ncbi:MAG TPA: phage/plasmid primase, P4 family [Xanthobacteraceae bacterium]|nr:phage/plasmid primase, P4 family [Xanthobacteraceae bacterium]